MTVRQISIVLGPMLLAAAAVFGLTACGGHADTPGSTGPAEAKPSSLAVYFNDPLAGLPLMHDFEAQADGLGTALIALIDSASQSIDAAVYNVSSDTIIQALRRACGRSVRIRLLTEKETSQNQTYPSCVQVRLDENDRLMHDKFAIVDREIVWTGSTNWTSSGIQLDANNAVAIHDASVAAAYETEFEQMFVQKRFGQAKQDAHQERFQIGEIPLEIYFSPNDHPEMVLMQLINSAHARIEIAMFTLTENDLYKAISDARGRGVEIRAIWDFTGLQNCQFSEVDELLKDGVGLLDANPGLLHDKYAIVDDEIVITGSANWSASGLGTSPSGANDEDLVVIHSTEIATRYHQNFSELYQDAQRYESDNKQPPRVEIEQFGTAGNGTALITWRPHLAGVVHRYELCRMDSPDSPACEGSLTVPGSVWYFVDRELTPGSYFYRVRNESAGQRTDFSNVVVASVSEKIPLLSAEEAKDSQYQGKMVTVRFTVVNKPEPKGQAGNIFLDYSSDYRSDFTGFIPGCAIPRFNGSGLDLFALQGRTVELTGELSSYNGPEVVVTEPWQVRCLDCAAPSSIHD
jgi:phosphatidylserine/phosphatidylglycerophosphate/cardiolipin synthase-like enzyme